MSNEVEFNSLPQNDEVKVKLEQPQSRIPQKPSDEEVAKYSTTRLVLVVFFTLIIIAMVVAAVVIIIVSPKCSKAKELDKSWFKNKIVYQINPSSFKDSNGDGKGDLKGITEKLDYFKDLGVEILSIDVISADDFKNVTSSLGKLSDFDDLMEKAKKKGIKVLVNFVPNHTSDKNKWFIDSKSKVNSGKRGWYVWRKSPNNWASVKDGSAWEKDLTTEEYYLHQFDKDQPDLNLRNQSVVDELIEVLNFWTKKGVAGFKAGFIQYMLEDKEFRDEKVKANYNASVLTYDMLDNNQTFDLPGNLDIVKQFRVALDKSDSHKLLILDVQGSDIAKFYAHSDLPTFTGLITDVKKGDVARTVNKTVSNYLASLPKDGQPNFAISSSSGGRVGDRLGSALVNAMNVLVLTLPGSPFTYFGEESGMTVNGLLKWTNGSKAEKVYKAVAKLREEDAFKTTAFKVVQVDKDLFAYTRGDKYLVVINFGNKWEEDLTGLSGRGDVVFDSEFKLKGKKLDINKISLEAGQALIFELEDHKYM